MARKFRRFSRRTRRKYRRRGFRGRKSLRSKVASINRRLAAEVKKNDNAVQILTTDFAELTAVGLHDYCYIYPVVDATMSQGNQLDDIVGESIKIKYLYLGFHLQQACNSLYPVTLRIMVVQDRNYKQYTNGIPTVEDMFTNLFGMNNTNVSRAYGSKIDTTLLPLNPLEPGRFQILRDFKMRTSPSGTADNYKKIMIKQSQTNSHGRIYFGPNLSPQYETRWTTAVGAYQASPEPGTLALYFDYQVTGSRRPTTQPPAVFGRTGPFVLAIPQLANLTEAYWENLQLQRYPYQVEIVNEEPGDVNIDFSSSRNGIYVVILRQNTPDPTASTGQVQPIFGLSIQSRLAYYDN